MQYLIKKMNIYKIIFINMKTHKLTSHLRTRKVLTVSTFDKVPVGLGAPGCWEPFLEEK
jgi:hypothetical protein